ncbi:hypothetical protein AArc1_5107 (plasmid) [Natrarchaeobaculum sulfurireducens]|uniref:Uncharacterized protein n=1 Tax=Natrarchaeobaculum sulfurireducens TaxID=2044521 RepID=A0A346P9W3_9EURY|nr:hypothetical protein AArc1_5107 [Natrarchaeobaculum sulfurireducens]
MVKIKQSIRKRGCRVRGLSVTSHLFKDTEHRFLELCIEPWNFGRLHERCTEVRHDS